MHLSKNDKFQKHYNFNYHFREKCNIFFNITYYANYPGMHDIAAHPVKPTYICWVMLDQMA